MNNKFYSYSLENLNDLFGNKITNLEELIKTNGSGTKFLSDNGDYKEPISVGTGLTSSIVSGSTEIKTKLRNETNLTIDSAYTTMTDKVYPVLLDKSGYLAVGVPWISYDLVTTKANGLMSFEDKKLINFFKSYNEETVNTLSELNIEYSTIYAELSEPTNISLSGELSVGRSITVICNPTNSFI